MSTVHPPEICNLSITPSLPQTNSLSTLTVYNGINSSPFPPGKRGLINILTSHNISRCIPASWIIFRLIAVSWSDEEDRVSTAFTYADPRYREEQRRWRRGLAHRMETVICSRRASSSRHRFGRRSPGWQSGPTLLPSSAIAPLLRGDARRLSFALPKERPRPILLARLYSALSI